MFHEWGKRYELIQVRCPEIILSHFENIWLAFSHIFHYFTDEISPKYQNVVKSCNFSSLIIPQTWDDTRQLINTLVELNASVTLVIFASAMVKCIIIHAILPFFLFFYLFIHFLLLLLFFFYSHNTLHRLHKYKHNMHIHTTDNKLIFW